MSFDGSIRENLVVGMEVEINPQGDRSRTRLVRGEIEEVLTRGSNHPHGILVRLKGGQIGRVKKILSGSNCETKTATSFVQSGSLSQKDVNFETLVANGESHFVEFKSSALWSQNYSSEEIGKSSSKEVKEYGKEASRIVIAKTIASLLNSDGGHLVIGIKENKTGENDEMIGIESEFRKLTDQCDDGYRRMIIDRIMKPYFSSDIFNHINDYIEIVFKEVDKKTLCWIQVRRSDIKAFLRINKRDLFFIRVDATTRQIHGEEIVDYCLRRFNQ